MMTATYSFFARPAPGTGYPPRVQMRPEQSDSAAAACVLVVDDDPSIRGLIEMALEDEGYRVVTAANGQEALYRIAELPPDLVLLDLSMPVMNGWQLQARLRDETPEIPVVFMTAGYRAGAEAAAHHAAGHLGKPFDLDDLLDTVARFTAGPRD